VVVLMMRMREQRRRLMVGRLAKHERRRFGGGLVVARVRVEIGLRERVAGDRCAERRSAVVRAARHGTPVD